MGNRESTEKKLIETVGDLIARRGFKELGVNAIAREASIGKTLIYRYFGGLSELVLAFARSVDFWPNLDELLGGDPILFLKLNPEEQACTLLKQYLRAIRKRPLTLEILAWEMVDRNELTIILEKRREDVTIELFHFFNKHRLQYPFDIQGVMAIFSSSINYLASRSRKIKEFGGVNIQSENGWEQIENDMLFMIHSLFR